MTPEAAARALIDARASRRQVPTFTGQDAAFDVTRAYAIETAARRLREADGHQPVGRKVGFANKAVWRILNLDTLVWAHVYDDTVHYTSDDRGALSLNATVSPKIEPEIVFKLKHDLQGDVEPAAALRAVDWIALGFEIIDCPFPEWSFKPADFIAAFGLHAALVIGTPRKVDDASIPTLIDELARFKVQLLHDDAIVAEGSGRNVLRSPALCLAELASAISKRPDAKPLSAGELVSSGTLTDPQLISDGETWTARVSGLPLPALMVTT